MKILLDECLDWRLGRELVSHTVTNVPRMGWASIKNGRLLALAAKAGFDVFLTVDKRLPSQQHLARFQIAVLVLVVKSNRLPDLKLLVPEILSELPKTKKGKATFIGT